MKDAELYRSYRIAIEAVKSSRFVEFTQSIVGAFCEQPHKKGRRRAPLLPSSQLAGAFAANASSAGDRTTRPAISCSAHRSSIVSSCCVGPYVWAGVAHTTQNNKRCKSHQNPIYEDHIAIVKHFLSHKRLLAADAILGTTFFGAQYPAHFERFAAIAFKVLICKTFWWPHQVKGQMKFSTHLRRSRFIEAQ